MLVQYHHAADFGADVGDFVHGVVVGAKRRFRQLGMLLSSVGARRERGEPAAQRVPICCDPLEVPTVAKLGAAAGRAF